ncbi:M20 family metallo-hydrolase [Clostridium butyricum]|uniref:M20 family metallo-hydrolase n=1 Tax=Clostridium butyricum TaxID=1492 RepID=UPI00374F9C36
MFKKADYKNIKRYLEDIDTFNSTPDFGTTRVLFTEEELKARKYVKNEMNKIGLEVSEDAMGNIFGILTGEDSSLSPVWTGSHIDTVLNAGMFDGMAGVVSGMEALRIIKESNLNFKRDIKVIVYTSEEPTRFGLSCLGSRAMAGELTLEDIENLKDKDGKSLSQVLRDLGYNLEEFNNVKVKKGDVFAAVELHIEQGGVLEHLNLPIGIVHTIEAPTNFDVFVKGKQSHAGGTPMNLRKDAFLACCDISLELERLAKESLSEDTVATVGVVDIIPNAANVISGYVHFTMDIRDSDYDIKCDLINKLKEFIKEVEKQRMVEITLNMINDDIPTKSDEQIVELLENICESKDIPYKKMVSGAYHDSMMVGKFAPVSMIFVPSKDGVSHSPDEWTDFEDIALGTDILAETLFTLANS